MPRNARKDIKKGLGKGLGALLQTSEQTFEEINQQQTHELPLKDIEPNPDQPRKNFTEDALETLMESIKNFGIVQPIVVRKKGKKYQIVAGERRYRAASALGLDQVPVIIKDYSTEEVTEIALVENLQRQDLDPIEEAFAYQRLMDTFKQTQDLIATRVGRSRSHVANMMRLLKLPEAIQNDLSVGELTIGQARPLLSLSNEKTQLEVAEKINSLASTKKSKTNKKPTKKDSAELRALTERLKLSLGSPVNIKLKAGKKVQGKIEISFASEEELNRLLLYMEASSAEGELLNDVFHV